MLAFRYEDLAPGPLGLPAKVLMVYDGRGERLCRVDLGVGEAVVRLEAGLEEQVQLVPRGKLRVFPSTQSD